MGAHRKPPSCVAPLKASQELPEARGETLAMARLKDVLQTIAEIAHRAHGGDYLYRGEPACYPRVSSSLYREFPNLDGQHFHVESIQTEMLQAAKRFIGEFDDDEDVLAQLQHFGYSTNLIDFTTDYHIALFFACDGKPQMDGRVVFVRPSDYPLLKPKNPSNRVIVQKSVFVRPEEGVVEPAEVVVIPSAIKSPILDHLDRCHGISVATVYNDLHGFMRYHEVHRSAYAELYAGIAYYVKGEHESAVERFRKAIQINPHLVLAYNNRGAAFMALGKHAPAIKDFNRVIDLDSSNAGAYNNRGVAYKGQGNYRAAIRDFEIAVDLNPGFASAYDNRANVHRAEGNYGSAIKDHDKAIKLEPDSAPSLSNRGSTYHAMGNHDRAIQDYDQAIQLEPDMAVAFSNRGCAHWHNGSRDQAVRDYERAIELNPGLAVAYFNRGISLLASGAWEEAQCELKKAKKLGLELSHEFGMEFGSVATFERKYGVQLPPAVVALLTS